MNFGFGISKTFTSNTTPSEIVFFDTADPNTGGTVFDPNTPETTDTLYVSSSDASTWIWNGSAYVSYTAPSTASTPFYLWGTTIDAGSNKTATIYRIGSISVRSALGNLFGDVKMTNQGFYASANSETRSYLLTASNTSSVSPKRTSQRWRGALNSSSDNELGDYINQEIEVSKITTVYQELTEATEDHDGSVTGIKKVFRTTKNGSNTLEDRLEFTEDGEVKFNNAYKFPTTDGTAGQVPKTDGAGNVTWEDGGGGGGICGISDATGTYTYYATLNLAMASASGGDTIEMFADIEETTSTTVTLIPDITINGNGHIYKLSVDDNTNAFTFNSSGTVFLNNITIIRTGRSVNANGYCLRHISSGSIVKGNGCQLINTYGSGTWGAGSLYGLNITAVYRGVYNPFASTNIYDTNIECTGSTGEAIYVAAGETVNCYAKVINGNAILNGAGRVYNSVGISTNGIGIFCNGEVYDSIGKSVSSKGLSGQRLTNCVGISTSSFGIACTSGRNCVGISTSGVGGQGDFHNSTLISSSNYAFSGTGTRALYNCYVASSSSITTFRPNLYNSTVVCKWDNAGGHCTTSNVLLELEIVNSSFKVTNSSAYCINGYGGAGGSTWKYANNSFEGSTTPVNTANISQGITNTSDSQGNILI